jgi:NAD(P)-dependent dehydrogenase (short-subunit alcohol dehydrogenase family)
VNLDSLEDTRRSIEEMGSECLAMRVDVRSQEQVETFVYGKIVNITSVMSVVAAQGQSIYNTSKGAAKMMTQGIAVDVSGYNINVNAVGMARRSLWTVACSARRDRRRRLRRRCPAEREFGMQSGYVQILTSGLRTRPNRWTSVEPHWARGCVRKEPGTRPAPAGSGARLLLPG